MEILDVPFECATFEGVPRLPALNQSATITPVHLKWVLLAGIYANKEVSFYERWIPTYSNVDARGQFLNRFGAATSSIPYVFTASPLTSAQRTDPNNIDGVTARTSNASGVSFRRLFRFQKRAYYKHTAVTDEDSEWPGAYLDYTKQTKGFFWWWQPT